MAIITLDVKKLQKNYEYLNQLFAENGIEWAVVTKLLCGNKTYLQELINLGVKQMCDSRISNLKIIKSLSKEVETVYIKPPPKRSISAIVSYADVSFNTEISTIKMLSKEAQKQNKTHKIVIMIEMGELREGVLRDDLIAFYAQIFELPNIQLVGLGTNLTCMNGVLPSQDKLIQLCLYQQLIEATFNKEFPYVTGGSSVTIPLIFERLLPAGVNHFRVGETLFLGTNVYNNTPLDDMAHDVFELKAEIIELTEKPMMPVGEMGHNLTGDKPSFAGQDQSITSFRAILNIGLLDIDEEHIMLRNKELSIIGASSDMLVVDLGTNKDNYQVGDQLAFNMDYMGILRLMNSRYVEKQVKR